MSVRKAVFCSHRGILLFLSPCFLWCNTGLCFGSYSVFITPAADFQEVCWWNPNLFPLFWCLCWSVYTISKTGPEKKMIVVPLWMISLMPLCLVFLIVIWLLEVWVFSECPLCISVMNTHLSIRRHDSRFTLDKDFFFALTCDLDKEHWDCAARWWESGIFSCSPTSVSCFSVSVSLTDSGCCFNDTQCLSVRR